MANAPGRHYVPWKVLRDEYCTPTVLISTHSYYRNQTRTAGIYERR